MPTINDPRTDSTVVKKEMDGHESREHSTAPVGLGPLEVGTVLRRAANGTLAVLTVTNGTTGTPGGEVANCVLLEPILETTTEARRVVTLWRNATVVRQELRFPEAYPVAEVDAAIGALRTRDIAVRRGV